MWQVELLTAWIGTATDIDPNRPQAADDFGLLEWKDVTGQQNVWPDPNVYVIQAACEAVVLDEIEAHIDYGPGAILWSEEL